MIKKLQEYRHGGTLKATIESEFTKADAEGLLAMIGSVIAEAKELERERMRMEQARHNLEDKNWLTDYARLIHQNNKEKGFFDEPKNMGEMIALIHAEVSEALEADRKDRYAQNAEKGTALAWALSTNDESHFIDHFEEHIKDTFEDEIADILMRVLDLAAFKQVYVDGHIAAKMRYNATRPPKHGKKY